MTAILDAQLVIAGTDYSGYLVSSERNDILESPGATLSIILSASFPHTAILPWDDLVFSENGTQVFTGYVTHIIASREPAQTQLQAMDTFKRCQDWFIDDQLYTGGVDAELSTDLVNRTISYYTDYLCNLCGISFSIDDPTGEAEILIADIPLGMRSVADALIVMCQVGQWTMRVDPDGVLHFEHLANPTVADYTLNQVGDFDTDTNDTDTKNKVKVWGFQDPDHFTPGGSILYQETRTVAGVPNDRTMVFAIPQVDTLAKAHEVARISLDQWARLERIASVETVGNPTIRVGQSFQFFRKELTSGSYFDVVTDLKSQVGAGGYVQNLTAGRRAYRYPYWPQPGKPPIEGDGGIVTGVAYDCAIFGGSVYSCGITMVSGCVLWRVERRLVTDASLVWGRTIAHVPSNASYFQGAYGIDVNEGGVYVTGDAATDATFGNVQQFVECYHPQDGHLLWSTQMPDRFGPFGTMRGYGNGQDIVVTPTQVLVLANGLITIRFTQGVPYSFIEGPSLWSLALATGVKGIHYPPVTQDSLSGVVVTSFLGALRRLALDSSGNVLTCGYYSFPYFRQTFPGIQPPDPYLYHSSPWYGRINLTSTVYEVKGPQGTGDIANSGQWLGNTIDASLGNSDYIVGTDSFFSLPSGGLKKNGSWRVNIGEHDSYCHMAAGRYLFVTNQDGASGVVQWYNKSTGAYISERTKSGVGGLHGIQLYNPTNQMAVCGSKDGLFWTGIWDQPL